jgi:hypothetical protein
MSFTEDYIMFHKKTEKKKLKYEEQNGMLLAFLVGHINLE